MSLPRFTLYFLSISACAVVLFPRVMPIAASPLPTPQYSTPFNCPPTGPVPPMRLSLSRRFVSRHRRLAPATMVASN